MDVQKFSFRIRHFVRGASVIQKRNINCSIIQQNIKALKKWVITRHFTFIGAHNCGKNINMYLISLYIQDIFLQVLLEKREEGSSRIMKVSSKTYIFGYIRVTKENQRCRWLISFKFIVYDNVVAILFNNGVVI